MRKYHLSKEETRELLEKQVHMVTTTQELQHTTRNFLRVVGDYLVPEGTLIRAIATCPCHIKCFEHKHDKDLAGNNIFSTDIIDIMNKWVQVLLHLCNTKSLEEVETGAMS